MSDKMHYYSLFVCFVLLAIAGSKSGSASQNDKQEASLEKKVQQLTEWSKKESVIRMNGDKFRQYVKTSPRNYSVIVMLTALQPQRQCMPCLTTKAEYEILADSWRFSRQYINDLFFAMVDFDEGSDVFQSLKVSSAPVFKHFPAKGKPKKADTLDPLRATEGAESLAKWVAKRTDKEIEVHRPPNYFLILSVVVLAGAACVLLYLMRNNLHHFYNKTCWGVLILAVIFAMISGFMWNRIRHPPFKHTNHRTGETLYINRGSRSQYVVETYIIMLLHCSVVAGFIMMNEIHSLKWRAGKIILALAGLGCVIVFFNLLLSVYTTKSPYYPYSFF